MALVLSRQPFTAEARVLAGVSPCGISIRQSGQGQVFLRVHRSSAVSIILPWLSVLIYYRGMNNTPAGGRSSETFSHAIYMVKISSPAYQNVFICFLSSLF
jgi:hypothetical protein